MPSAQPAAAKTPRTADDCDGACDADALARELMMPAGEPAVAVIGACLLIALVWFIGSGHLGGGSAATPAAAAPSLNASGGPIAPPAPHGSAS